MTTSLINRVEEKEAREDRGEKLRVRNILERGYEIMYIDGRARLVKREMRVNRYTGSLFKVAIIA